MFGIGWSEFIVIGVVALIAIGPKELPGVLRMVGQSIGKIRRIAGEFQGQFQDAMREAEMADVKKEIDDLSTSATDIASIDPIGDADREIDRALSESGTGEPAASEAVPSEPATSELATSEPGSAEATPLPEPPSPVEEAAQAAVVEPETKQAGAT